MLKTLYQDNRGKVRINGEFSNPFNLDTGLKQGCLLSPALFNIYLDFILRRWAHLMDAQGIAGAEWESGKDETWGTTHMSVLTTQSIRHLLYADDIALVARSEADLRRMLITLEAGLREWGLHMSIAKTKIMTIGKDEHISALNASYDADPLILRGEPVKRVPSFTYLGSILQLDGTSDLDITQRSKKAWGAFWLHKKVWRQKGLSMNIKVQLYNAAVFPILTYGAECWSTTTHHLAQLERHQVTFLSNILHLPAGLRRAGHIPDEELRARAKVPKIEEIIRTKRLRWIGHVLRMPHRHNPRGRTARSMVDGGLSKPPLPSRRKQTPYQRILRQDARTLKIQDGQPGLGALPQRASKHKDWKDLSNTPLNPEPLTTRRCPRCKFAFESCARRDKHVESSTRCNPQPAPGPSTQPHLAPLPIHPYRFAGLPPGAEPLQVYEV